MKHEQFWMMCAAAGASVMVIVGAAGAALAEPAQNPITILAERPTDHGLQARVSYRDLNLVSAHDVRILNRRVGGAARTVCEPIETHVGAQTYSDCVAFAWNGARPQVALAVQRAREIAFSGYSAIPLVAIAVSVH